MFLTDRDLAELVTQGLGDREVSQCRPRCRKCGQEGQWQVRAPVPPAPGVGATVLPFRREAPVAYRRTLVRRQ